MVEYLILGFLFATLGMSLLNGLCEIISALFELLKTFIGVQIVKHNQKIEKLMGEEESSTRAIGFCQDWHYEEEDDDDYYE